MFHNNVVFVLIVLCTIVQSGVVAPNRNFQVVKNNGYELDCSQFHSDYDVLRQFPFPVMFISPDDDEYEKTVAIMDKNNTFVHTLAIRGENLVPMSVFCLSNLDTLEIERTPFENDIVPDALANLKILRHFWVYDVPIVEITEQLGTLTNLLMLILNNCSITYLPNLSNLQKLWCLDLPNNRLSHLDGISELGTLDLTSNFFTEIPIMKKHEKLWYLVMNHNPLKDAVPILSYKNLEGIYLSNTTLTSIPPAIGKLQGLKYLHLSDNKISHLPNKIFDLPLLAEFDISKNLLSPDDIQSIREAFAKSHPTIQLQV